MSSNEVEDAARRAGAAGTALLTAALAIAEARARHRATQLRERAARDERTRLQAVQEMRAEADLAAVQWRAAANAGPEWIDGYASAAQWRHVDPRAAAAARQIEESLKRAGVEIPTSTLSQDWYDTTVEVLGDQPPQTVAEEAGSGQGIDRATRERAEPELGTPVSEAAQAAAAKAAAATVGADKAAAWQHDARWPDLAARVDQLATKGYDPVATVRTAIEMRELDSAKSPVALISWRVEQMVKDGTAPRLTIDARETTMALLDRADAIDLQRIADTADVEARAAHAEAVDPATEPPIAEAAGYDADEAGSIRDTAQVAADATDPATIPSPRLGRESHPEGGRQTIPAGQTRARTRHPGQPRTHGKTKEQGR